MINCISYSLGFYTHNCIVYSLPLASRHILHLAPRYGEELARLCWKFLKKCKWRFPSYWIWTTTDLLIQKYIWEKVAWNKWIILMLNIYWYNINELCVYIKVSVILVLIKIWCFKMCFMLQMKIILSPVMARNITPKRICVFVYTWSWYRLTVRDQHTDTDYM